MNFFKNILSTFRNRTTEVAKINHLIQQADDARLRGDEVVYQDFKFQLDKLL